MKLLLIYECVFGEKGLQVTEKGLAKAGIRKPEIPTKPEPSKNHFRFFKFTKNKKTKWFFAAKSAEIF